MARLICVLAVLFATSARAEDWKVLWWDDFNLIAVNASSPRTTDSGNPAFELLKVTSYLHTNALEATLSEEEVQCDEQRVRTRRAKSVAPSAIATGENTEFTPWRDPGQELDGLLVSAACDPAVLRQAALVRDATTAQAGAAHVAFAKHPAKPGTDANVQKWAAAYKALNDYERRTNIPSILIATHGPHHFMPTVLADGQLRMIDIAFSKASEGRYRFHEMLVGRLSDPRNRAGFSLWEIDCGLRKFRLMAYASFDARGAQTEGRDTNFLGAPFKPIVEGTSHEQAFNFICVKGASEQPVWTIRSDLKQAIEGYDAFYSPSLLTALGAGPDTPWREAYQVMCGRFGCETHPSVRSAAKVAIGVGISLLLGGGALVLRRIRRRGKAEDAAPSTTEV